LLETLSKNGQAARRLTWLILALGLALRLAVSGQFLLTPDEANYWQWSRYLDIGYHDHPPMIAWTIWLAAQLFGQTAFAVRLPTVLGMSVASACLCLLAARWFSWQTAKHVALLSQAVLLFTGAALIATPDGLLLPCWAAACWAAARAVERGRQRDWLLVGLCFGLGLLSKYTMLLFPVSLFGFLLCSREQRAQLLTRKPWLGLLAGLLLFTPVVIWNSRHNWVTFRHVLFQGGVSAEQEEFTLRYLWEFLGSQAGLLSPLMFWFILAAWLRGWRNGEKACFLLWLSLPGFAIFTLLSLHGRIYGNWPAPAYLSMLILAAAMYARSSRWWNAGLVLAFVLSGLLMLQLVWPALPVPAKWDRIAQETQGWDELAQQVEQARQDMPRPAQTFIFGLRYQFASELAFHLPGQPRTVSINRWSRPNVYDFWFDEEMLIGMDAVGVHEHKGMDAVLREVFEEVEPETEIIQFRSSPWFGREVLRRLYLVRCRGYKSGGLRWQPKQAGDIRAVTRFPQAAGSGRNEDD
jgi:undecaprenyl-diphosphatase